ncbi:hypothetical protein PsalMR5_04732 (plasmid) [Piscirickettsia salmonis]|uniref:hypothetical protein n=1 Tax=Piscirickettsia salmonis TaxID=1238 RepID=UPI0012BACCC5|nr:hypothetical protein [Piscirickettsia salmonis]QGP57272.1 hypothetical protein PsalSR1_04761 [Piscirickettsia salmonis]QGP66807.1 hypothetical protein PsalMR5_04732 [Piscirickettsia salmonis]
MTQPLINPITEKEIKITFRTKDTLSHEINLYVDYLNDCNGGESVEKDDVISELCRYVLDKDKGFKEWKKKETKHKIKVSKNKKEKTDSTIEIVKESA